MAPGALLRVLVPEACRQHRQKGLCGLAGSDDDGVGVGDGGRFENRPSNCFHQRALVILVVCARGSVVCGLGVGHGTALQCRLTMWK